MSAAPILEAITEAAIDLIPTIVKWVREGLSNEEIEKRLRDPSSIGAKLLKESADRQQLGRDLLGRDPNP